jgi:adenylate cyclase
LYFAAILHHLRREEELAQEYAEAAITVSTEHGLSIYQAFALIGQGAALVEQGLQEDGITRIRQGIAMHEATGARLARPHFLALLAGALHKGKQTEEGLRVVEEGLALSHQRREERYLSELYRLKGELLLQRDEPIDAAGCFNEAIKVAQRQVAKSWELRASLSLARLNGSDGLTLLSGVYNRFTEGFDTKDLQEAKFLLDDSAQ